MQKRHTSIPTEIDHAERRPLAWLKRIIWPLLEQPLKYPHFWTWFGWFEIVQTYRRTLLGPFWITANLIIFTIVMTFVYGAIFGVPTKEYSSYVLCSLIAWYWVSALIAEVGNTFVANAFFIRGSSIDKAQLIWSQVYKQLITFGHNIVVVGLYILVGVIPLNVHTLQIVPAIMLLFLFSIPATAVAAILFARYRDLQRLVSGAMLAVLMVTPVFWEIGMMKGWRKFVIGLNPIYYLIELVRRPLLGQPTEMVTYLVVLLMVCVLWIAGGLFYNRYQRYVVFWV